MISILISGQLTCAPEHKMAADGRPMVTASIKARLGRDKSEGWQIISFSPVVRKALSGLTVGSYVAAQGSPAIRVARIGAEPVIQRTVFAEAVLALKPGEASDV
jgi:hypothetical protein